MKPLQTSKIYAFATKGSGTNEEARLQYLLSGFGPTLLPFDKSAKRSSALQLWRKVRCDRPDLLIMEGTGVAGGIVCLLARWFLGIRYVLSSGDAVGPFIAATHPLIAPIFAIYERILCLCCDGFIGWTPYLVGRALTFGARRAMTAAGWNSIPVDPERLALARTSLRSEWGIDDDTIVFGIIGSLVWNARYQYCYGAELVRAVLRVPQDRKVVVVIGGDGSGLEQLKRIAAQAPHRIRLLGSVPQHDVINCLAAMDVASLPQSVDNVGSFRYTTKLSEIIAAGLPVVTGQIPLAYDLDTGWIWRLRGSSPWSEDYVAQLADLMGRIGRQEIRDRSARVPRDDRLFSSEDQSRRVAEFINDLCLDLGRRPSR